jgi:hypothetical protein
MRSNSWYNASRWARMRKEPIHERGWFMLIYILALMFGIPALYFLHMNRVLGWVNGIAGFYNVLFGILGAASLVLLVVLIIQLIGRGLS